MAIVQNPITGRTRKKFGTAVFSKIFEVNTMRTKPIDVKNPRTEAQMIQREKFATTVELMRQIIPVINEAYDGSITKMSPFNHNVSKTLKEAFDPVTHELDYSKVILCDNEGSNVEDVTMTCLPARAIELDWDPATTDSAELAAEITILLVNADKNKIRVYKPGVARSAGTASLIAPTKWVGDKVGVFVMATDYTSENPQPNLPHPPRILIEFKAGFDATSIVQ